MCDMFGNIWCELPVKLMNGGKMRTWKAKPYNVSSILVLMPVLQIPYKSHSIHAVFGRFNMASVVNIMNHTVRDKITRKLPD